MHIIGKHDTLQSYTALDIDLNADCLVQFKADDSHRRQWLTGRAPIQYKTDCLTKYKTTGITKRSGDYHASNQRETLVQCELEYNKIIFRHSKNVASKCGPFCSSLDGIYIP